VASLSELMVVQESTFTGIVAVHFDKCTILLVHIASSIGANLIPAKKFRSHVALAGESHSERRVSREHDASEGE
jgi:hypothetical protein